MTRCRRRCRRQPCPTRATRAESVARLRLAVAVRGALCGPLCAILVSACASARRGNGEGGGAESLLPLPRHAVVRVEGARARGTPAAATTTTAVGAAGSRPLHWTAAHRDTLALWIDSATTAAWRPELATIVREAADAWREAGAPLRFARAADSTSADVRVHWRRWQEGTERGATTWRMNARGELVGADVVIVLAPGAVAPVSPPCQLRAITLHELGHALGLPHDRSRDAVMYWQTGAAPALTDRDRAAVRAAYANAGGGGGGG